MAPFIDRVLAVLKLEKLTLVGGQLFQIFCNT